MQYIIIDGCVSDSYISVVQRNTPPILYPFDAQNSASSFFVILKKVLSKYPLKTLDFLALCVGPGSFTSSRITVMCVKSLSFLRSLPIISFDSHIPLRSKNFKKESIMQTATKTSMTLSTGGSTPKLIRLSGLKYVPPSSLVKNPPYNMQILIHHLEEKYQSKQFCDPLKLTPLYLKNP